jgi:hypothetical protein
MTDLTNRLLSMVTVGLGASLLGGAGTGVAAVILFPVGVALAYVIRPSADGTHRGSPGQTL